jgi:hypothetical protein
MPWQTHTGTVVGTPTFGAAKFSNGLTATTDANYITLPSGTSPAGLLPGLTWEAWLNVTSAAIKVALCLSANATWMGVLANGHFGCSYNGGGTLDSGIAISGGAWHHCAVVFTATSMLTFVDGSAGASIAITFNTGLATSMLVGRFQSTTFAWTGSIDEVAIWFIQKYSGSYTVPTVPYVGNETGLWALYHLQSDGTDSITLAPLTVFIDAPITDADKTARHQIVRAASRDSNAPGFASPVPVAAVLQGGTTGIAYTETITAQGGTSPYTYAVIGGSLPTGLSLTGSSGLISGTPTVVATSTFTIGVTDANGYTGSQNFSITVVAPASGGVSNYGFVS